MQISAVNPGAEASAIAGLDMSRKQFNRAAAGMATGGDTVSFSKDAVTLLEAKHAAQADVHILKAVDDLQRSVMAMLGGAVGDQVSTASI